MKNINSSRFSIEKVYLAQLDERHRVTIKKGHSEQYLATQYANGCIAMEPAKAKRTISDEESARFQRMVSKSSDEPVHIHKEDKNK